MRDAFGTGPMVDRRGTPGMAARCLAGMARFSSADADFGDPCFGSLACRPCRSGHRWRRSSHSGGPHHLFLLGLGDGKLRNTGFSGSHRTGGTGRGCQRTGPSQSPHAPIVAAGCGLGAAGLGVGHSCPRAAAGITQARWPRPKPCFRLPDTVDRCIPASASGNCWVCLPGRCGRYANRPVGAVWRCNP